MAKPLELEPIKAFRVPTMVVTSSPVPSVAAINLVLEQRRALLAEVERLRNTEAWDEVERLRGVVERLELEKFDLAERLMRTGSKPT